MSAKKRLLPEGKPALVRSRRALDLDEDQLATRISLRQERVREDDELVDRRRHHPIVYWAIVAWNRA